MDELALQSGQTSPRRGKPGRSRPQSVSIDAESLKTFCSTERQLTADDLDLLWLSAHIAHWDRTVPRRRSTGWARTISFEMEVADPARWSDGRVRNSLLDCLNFLSGDRWNVTFVRRKVSLDTAVQLQMLSLGNQIKTVQPFSGGLDSLATAVLLQRNGDAPLPVTTNVSAAVAALADAALATTTPRIRAVKVRVQLGHMDHPEQTYRTRTLLYFCIAAVAARLTDIKRVVLSEPGQGAIGASMVSFDGEHPVRGTHPAFTGRLETFLAALWGATPRFEHPNLWRTKSQLIADFAKVAAPEELLATRSCSRRMAQGRGMKDAPRSCGICSGCLFRRMSLVAAGLPDRHDAYVWHDLHCADMKDAAGGGLEPESVDREVAAHALVTMRDFADLVGAKRRPSVDRTIREVMSATGLAEGEVRDRVDCLIQRHAGDWATFLEYAGRDSWVARLAGR